MFANLTERLRSNVTQTYDNFIIKFNNQIIDLKEKTGSNEPYKPRLDRGKWETSVDFYSACLSHAFGMKHFTLLPKYIFMHWALGGFFLVSYLLDLFIFTLPIFFIQSFLGQFSNSGFISVFRIAPAAKGLGYVILVLNIITASYYSVNAAVPLVFLFTSIQPTLPWTTCDNSWNTIECKEEPIKRYLYMKNDLVQSKTLASTEFFYKAIALSDTEGWQISWRILACTILVWLGIIFVIHKGLPIISKLLRYSTYLMLIILVILFFRIFALPGTVQVIKNFFIPNYRLDIVEFFILWVYSAAPAALTFGPGWGTILTISSFNRFNRNIKKLSLFVCFSHMIIVIITGFSVFLVREYLLEKYDFNIQKIGGFNQIDFAYTGFPYFFGKLELSQLWSMMFYLMLFLAEFSSCIIQIFSVTTAIFDEHIKAREQKKKLLICLFTILICSSIFFATNRGFVMFSVRYSIEGIIQMLICLLELSVIVWIYGRFRFQRDVKFMLNYNFKTWKFFLLRFITPLCILLVLIFYIIIARIDVFENKYVLNPTSLMIIKLIPFFIFIPGYILIKLLPIKNDNEENLNRKLKKLCKTKDWFPIELDDYHKYENECGIEESNDEDNDIDDEQIENINKINLRNKYNNYRQENYLNNPPIANGHIIDSRPIIHYNEDISQLRRITAADICIEFDI